MGDGKYELPGQADEDGNAVRSSSMEMMAI
jgi:hypothetical protein